MYETLVFIGQASVGNHIRYYNGDVVKVVKASRKVVDGKITITVSNGRESWTEIHNRGVLVYLTSRDVT
jgi:hypothetical protein